MAISMDALEAEIKSLKRRVEVLEKEYTALNEEVNAIDKTQSVVTSKLNTVIETLGKLQTPPPQRLGADFAGY